MPTISKALYLSSPTKRRRSCTARSRNSDCWQRKNSANKQPRSRAAKNKLGNDYGLQRNHRSAEDHARRERNEMLKVGIIVGSTRPGRKAAAVAEWVHNLLKSRNDAEFEIVD